MSEGEGHCWRLGLTTVLFGVTFILSMGVVSVQYPHKPPPQGVVHCGQPFQIEEPGKMDFGPKNSMEVLYSCPEEFRLEGPEKRVCKKASKTWEPTEERNSETKCVREEK